MNTYSIYDVTTGLFTGRTITCRPKHLDANVPDGYGAVLGDYDHRLHCVDRDTGSVLDYRTPAPSDGCVWDDIEARWIPAAELAAGVRAERDRLLAATDWRMMRAIERGEPPDDAWCAYREALRNVPEQAGFPSTVEWPIAPDAAATGPG